MASKKERAFAWFGVIIFTISAVALTAAVIIQEVITNRNNANTAATTAVPANTKKETNTLQGTQLQNFTPTADVSQLAITDQKAGEGQAVKAGDTVTVDYTGAVAATGVIFQSSLDSGQPISMPTTSFIKGWQEGLVGMKVGGERRLLIPAAEAYGANPPQGSGIPANAALVFDITLHKVGS